VRTEDDARWWERTSSVVDDQSVPSSSYSLGECLHESCCAIVPEDQDITIQFLQDNMKAEGPIVAGEFTSETRAHKRRKRLLHKVIRLG
jgi:hypothetical protein